MTLSISLQELAHHLSAKLEGDPQCLITGIASLDKATAGQITFLQNPTYRSLLNTTKATAVVLSQENASAYVGNKLIMQNPQLGYAKIATLFAPKPSAKAGIHPTAIIGEDCQIAADISIGAYCVIGDRVTIGKNTIISAGCAIGDDSVLGEGCLLYPHVILYSQVKIGDRAIFHSGAVIGADGFGMVNDKGVWHKIPQLGGVKMGDGIEVGANTTIDRGALQDTTIEDDVKLDNLIQIAHNVHIGAHTAIAAGTIIGGSTQIGKYCLIGGGVAIADHVQIVDGVILTGTAQVNASINTAGIYSSGIPAHPNTEWRRNIVRFLKLDELAKRVKKLEKEQKISVEDKL